MRRLMLKGKLPLGDIKDIAEALACEPEEKGSNEERLAVATGRVRDIVARGHQIQEFVDQVGRAAAGCFTAWPSDMADRMNATMGTELGWRVNRVGELCRAWEDGSYAGRETRAFGGYYKDD